MMLDMHPAVSFVLCLAMFTSPIVLGLMIARDRANFFEVRTLREPDEKSKNLEHGLHREAMLYSGMLISAFHRNGIQDEYYKDPRVVFERAVATETHIYFKLRALAVPRGSRISDLTSALMLEELMIVIQREVTTYITPESGAWLIVHRSNAGARVPEVYKPYLDRMYLAS